LFRQSYSGNPVWSYTCHDYFEAITISESSGRAENPDTQQTEPDFHSVAPRSGASPQGGKMLYWTLVFLVIAVIAGIFGFGAISVAAAGIAKILFFIFLVLFVVSLLFHLGRRGSV
jgi:uncharacterized membrane protein YtjA (UPF0391 family)